MLEYISGRQKLAAAFFVVGKINSVMCAVTMFVNIQAATYLLVAAVAFIGASIGLCCLDMRNKNESFEEFKRLDPKLQELVLQMARKNLP